MNGEIKLLTQTEIMDGMTKLIYNHDYSSEELSWLSMVSAMALALSGMQPKESKQNADKGTD